MLSYLISQDVKMKSGDYILHEEHKKDTENQNSEAETFREYRLQNVFTTEILYKLLSVGVSPEDLAGKKILDVCCGTGFLSYHLLKICPQIDLTLLDISPKELSFAESLISSMASSKPKFICESVNDITSEGEYDFIIGNSYIHHFGNVRECLRSLKKALKPGGALLTLHEPTLTAIGWEGGSLISAMKIFFCGESFLEKKRPQAVQKEKLIDIWTFTADDLKKLFREAGFQHILQANWGIFRPYLVAKNSLHLGPHAQSLTPFQSFILSTAIWADKHAQKIFPAGLFGSTAIAARTN